jgi:CrcB protein
LRTLLAVAAASAAGGSARYLLGGWLARPGAPFPWETLAINVSGSFALGFLFTLWTEAFAVAPWLRTAVLVGFLGSYTTFSTFALESFRLFEDGAEWLALANLIGSLVAGLLAVYGGIVLARAVS